MWAILNSLNANNLPIFERILMILVSKFMVHRALSDKTHLSLGLLSPFSKITLFSHNTTKTVTSWADAQTAQIVSFEILVLLMTLQVYCIIPKSPINKA